MKTSSFVLASCSYFLVCGSLLDNTHSGELSDTCHYIDEGLRVKSAVPHRVCQADAVETGSDISRAVDLCRSLALCNICIKL